jgi:hypothetical protein
MECLHAWIDGQKNPFQPDVGLRLLKTPLPRPGLLLPGAFFVAVGAQFLAPFMFVNFAFATFF